MHELVSIVFSSEMQRPSSAKLWHIPIPPTVLPNPPRVLDRTVPLDEHDTSYFADSVSIFSFFSVSSVMAEDEYKLVTSL